MSYAIVNAGVVVNVVEWDGDTAIWSPPEGTEAVLVQEGMTPYIGLAYANGVFAQPVPPQITPAEILANNTATRDALLNQAALAIAPLQDAVDLSMATSAETASLTLWKQYRVAVNRIDLTQASPVWPTAPAA